MGVQVPSNPFSVWNTCWLLDWNRERWNEKKSWHRCFKIITLLTESYIYWPKHQPAYFTLKIRTIRRTDQKQYIVSALLADHSTLPRIATHKLKHSTLPRVATTYPGRRARLPIRPTLPDFSMEGFLKRPDTVPKFLLPHSMVVCYCWPPRFKNHSIARRWWKLRRSQCSLSLSYTY